MYAKNRPRIEALLAKVANAKSACESGSNNRLEVDLSELESELDALRSDTLANPHIVPPGTVVDGRYRVVKLLGLGGMGVVYLAEDSRLDRLVALKLTSSERCRTRAELGVEDAGDTEVAGTATDLARSHAEHSDTNEIEEVDEERERNVRSRLVREAQITAKLEHPGIVSVYEIGQESDDDEPYYTMRVVHGETLNERIKEHHRSKLGRLRRRRERRKLLDAFVSLCNTVAYAHSEDVVHGDLKPRNVAVGDFGEVTLLDWGLASIVGTTDDDSGITSYPPPPVRTAGTDEGVTGTLLYMAPEQADASIGPVGPLTDVFGLGSVLFEILTDTAPHLRTTIRDVLDSVYEGGTRRVEELAPRAPKALAAICAKAMKKRPVDRYPTVSALVADVENYLADDTVSVHRASAGERLRHWVSRHRVLSSVGVVGLIAATLLQIRLVSTTLQERVETLASTLYREVEWGSEALMALKAYYETEESVTADEFERFAQPYIARGRGLRALEWIPKVPASEKREHESAMLRRGLPRSTITERDANGRLIPVSYRDTYYPVYFVYPLRGNESALGFDLGSSPQRRAALELARERKIAIGVAPVTLVQQERLGALILRAVFCREEASVDPELMGYVLGVYSFEELLASAWSDTSTKHLRVSVYDVTDPSEIFRVWTNVDEDDSAAVIESVEQLESWLSVSRQIEICGRKWLVTTELTLEFMWRYPWSTKNP